MRAATAVLMILLVAMPARASSPVVHAVVGDLVGAWLARHVGEWAPTAALAAGFASHPVLDIVDRDYTPDWTAWGTDRGQLLKDAPYLLVQAAGLLALALSIAEDPDPHARIARIAGVVGSLLPDLIEVPHSVHDPESWRRGDHILPWHRVRQAPQEAQSWHLTALISVAAVSLRLSVSF